MSRIYFTSIFLLSALFPAFVGAHASPVELRPSSGEQILISPKELSLRFSERLESGVSRARLEEVSYGKIETPLAQIKLDDPYTLILPLPELQNGIYIVSWSVVSKDDGHFTKGSYSFSVGKDLVAPKGSTASVVNVRSTEEVIGMSFEFLGNSIFLGVLLFSFLFLYKKETDTSLFFKKISVPLVLFGGLAGVSGGIFQLFWKSKELASLDASSFADSFSLYIGTEAGEATIFRIISLFFFTIFFFLLRNKLSSPKILLLFIPLISFAYFRASVSHATANPFLPDLSLFVNFIHVIEKDLWLGVLIILSLFSVLFASALPTLLSRIFNILSINFIFLSLTASYIVWLHLKSFSHLSSSSWGEAFSLLLGSALSLILFHSYHVVSSRFFPSIFSRYFRATLFGELLASFLVIVFSSLVIITSPPLTEDSPRLEVKGSDVFVTLEVYAPQDGTLLLSFHEDVETPLVFIGEPEGGTRIEAHFLSPGRFLLPLSLVESAKEPITIISSRENKYDIRVSFSTENKFTQKDSYSRSFNLFTLIMILCGASALIYGLFLVSLGRKIRYETFSLSFFSFRAFVLSIFIPPLLVLSSSLLFQNEFKNLCLLDGNSWHLMEPTRASVPVASVPLEGCMLYSGTYHYADKEEYEYLRTKPGATLSFVAENAIAGAPTPISISLSDETGAPALLSVEHEKLLHTIIVGEDMDYFTHLHPEDIPNARVGDSSYAFTHTFPKAGTYIVLFDYMHGIKHESQTFEVVVSGTPSLSKPLIHKNVYIHKGYEVTLDSLPLFENKNETLFFTVKKDGKEVTNLSPFLGAAMHIAVIKNDRSKSIHTHGEVHAPGNTQNALHTHVPPPPLFGPTVEAHVIFPNAGTYTLFGEFFHEGKVLPVKFSVIVE